MTSPRTGPFPGFAGGGVRALAGGVVWVIGLAITRPNPFDPAWAEALLVLAPLVLVPLGLDLVLRGGPVGRLARLTGVVQLPAALALGLAFLLPQGPAAAALALPWLLATGLVAGLGVGRLARRGFRPLAEVCLDAGLMFVAVGGVWAVADRLGFRPLDFEPVIVLLTATHFHYAGFALPLATGLALRTEGISPPSGRAGGVSPLSQAGGSRPPSPPARLAGVGVVAGVPLVAAGITATQLGWDPWLECLAAWVLALA